MSKITTVIGLGLLSSAVGTQHAIAQDDMFSRDRIVGAGERYQSEFEQMPLRAGGLLLQPSLGVNVESNSNIYATENDEKSDIVIGVKPELIVNSDWGRHGFGATINADHKEYSDYGDESHTDLTGLLRGRIDVTGDFNVALDAGYQELTEERGQTGAYSNGSQDLNLLEPAEYSVMKTGLALNWTRDRTRLSVGVRASDLEFDNVLVRDDVSGDEIELIRSFRDYNETNIDARFDYAVSPDVAVFVTAMTSDREYDTQADIIRDASGYRVAVGTNFQLEQLLRGEVSVGYLEEDRDDPRFSKLDGLAANLDLKWLPTELTTFSFGADRSVRDTGNFFVPSALVTSADIGVVHELKRNILLSADFKYSIEEFEANEAQLGVSYDQEYSDFGVGAIYKMNPHAHFDVNARHYSGDADASAGRIYDQTVLSVGVKLFP